MRALSKGLPAVLAFLAVGSGTVRGQEPPPPTPPGMPAPTVVAPTIVDCNVCDSCCHKRPWYLQLDAIVLHRSVGTSQLIAADAAGNPALRADTGRFNWDVGARAMVGIPLSAVGTLQLLYFGAYDQRNPATFAGAGTWVGSPGTAGDNFFSNYRSYFHNVEINYSRNLNQRLALLAGFRYLSWQENLNNTVNTAAGTSIRDYFTNNNLYGGQLGAAWTACLGQRLSATITGKAGLYGNDSSMSARANIANLGAAPTITNGSASQAQVAFIGDLGLVGTYRVSNHLALRGGYNLMWVEGIGLAPDQVNNSNFAANTFSDNTRGGVFLHGGLGGVELSW